VLLLVGVAGAPWVLGARWNSLAPWGWAAAFCAVTFLVRAGIWARDRRGPSLGPAGWALFLLLGGCLVYWWTRDDPSFATSFATSHWDFLQGRHPGGVLLVPRGLRLALTASFLLFGIAVADATRRSGFRDALTLTMGVSGLVVAAYAAAERWLQWPPPAWLQIERGGMDLFNGPFFHYSAIASAFNLAWPLLVFGGWAARHRRVQQVAIVVLLPVTVLLLPIWQAQLAWIIGGVLWALGTLWLVLAFLTPRSSRLILVALAVGFGGVTAFQAVLVHRLARDFPDGWQGAEMARVHAPQDDAAVQARALTRGDRLVASAAPARPVAWLAALRMARASGLVGEGPGAWVFQASLYSREPVMKTFFHHRQFAHHDVLQLAAEWGWLPAVAALGWVGLAFWQCLWRGDGSRVMGIVVALTGVSLHSLWNFPLQVPALQLWFIVLVAALWGAGQVPTSPPRTRDRAPV
jgi:hypothetical protein